MRNPGLKTYMGAVLWAMLLLSPGCVERQLEERVPDALLSIEFRWPDDFMAEGVQIWILDGNGSLHTTSLCDASRHELTLPTGIYSIRSVNTGIVNADCVDTGIIRARKDETTGLLLNVGNIYCAGAEEITVQGGVEPVELVLQHKNLVRTIRFELNIEEVGEFVKMELQLSGIVPSVRVSDGMDAGEPTGKIGATVRQERRSGSGTSNTAEISVLGWRGNNLLTGTISRPGGEVESIIPQDIRSRLDGIPDSGGSVSFQVKISSGVEIGISVSVTSWKSGTGIGTVN